MSDIQPYLSKNLEEALPKRTETI